MITDSFFPNKQVLLLKDFYIRHHNDMRNLLPISKWKGRRSKYRSIIVEIVWITGRANSYTRMWLTFIWIKRDLLEIKKYYQSRTNLRDVIYLSNFSANKTRDMILIQLLTYLIINVIGTFDPYHWA